MDKYLLKAVEKTNIAVPNSADDIYVLGLIWKPGVDVDVYQNTAKGGNVAFNFGVRMDRDKNMVAEVQLCFYRRNRFGHTTFAYASDEISLEQVSTMPEFSHLKTKPVIALLEVVLSFNKERFAVQKNETGFTLKI